MGFVITAGKISTGPLKAVLCRPLRPFYDIVNSFNGQLWQCLRVADSFWHRKTRQTFFQ
jgi:hypothetical protein